MKRYYWGIDLFKFIFSLLVICIHTNPLLDVNSKANLIVSGLLASFAVPYFFVVSGYMSGDATEFNFKTDLLVTVFLVMT